MSQTAILAISAIEFIGLFASVGFNVYIGLKQCSELRWRFVFFLKAVGSIFSLAGIVLVLVQLVRIVAADRRLERQYDLPHWCGVAVQMALCVLGISLSLMRLDWS